MDFIKKINSSKYVVVFLLIVIFLVMLYCNFRTPLKGDDFTYFYNSKDYSLIEHVSEIFVSMYYHRYTTNGRVIPHFFVQLFLLYDKSIFNLINSGMFVALIYLFYTIAIRFSVKDNKTHNAVLLLVIFGCVWVLAPSFGTVFLWLDGSCNYLWCAVLLLLWLFIMAKDYAADISMNLWQESLFSILSLTVGNYAENSSVAAVFMLMLFIAVSRLYHKRPLKHWHITSFCAMLIGFFLLAFAPAEFVTKIVAPSFSKYIRNFHTLTKYLLSFWPLIVFYILAFMYSKCKGMDKDVRILSLIFVGGAIAAHYVLLFALYIDGRSCVFSFVLLLLACALMFRQIFDSKLKGICCLCSAVLMIFLLYYGVVGLKDIGSVYYKWSYNDQYIRSEVASGKTKIQVPYIIPDTEYSCFYLWGYLREDPNDYVNIAMAKYYGADVLSGYWFYD